jgi:hypothetical protein
MTKKSKLENLRKENRKETQKKLRTETEVTSKEEREVVLPRGHITPRKAVVTFKMEDVLVGRSIYNIMEDSDAD